MSGFASNDAATALSTTYESRVNADRPVSKLTPRNTSVGRGGAPGAAARTDSGANRMRQPLASTGAPGGAGGHLGGAAGAAGAAGAGAGCGAACTASAGRGRPGAATLGPGGGVGDLSLPCRAPAGSGAAGQPLASTVAPAGVLGH